MASGICSRPGAGDAFWDVMKTPSARTGGLSVTPLKRGSRRPFFFIRFPILPIQSLRNGANQQWRMETHTRADFIKQRYTTFII
ncbi:hypothetical protein VNO77_44251 [Canavalia gladiata]|uniref:Uncharacterized protein n=1 Tax=Canavalia gladiata TaxID=3824 RepID=A0AAN9JYL4_CANGL